MKEYREIYVVKADGEEELFLQRKLERSLEKSGASKKLTKEIVDHVNAEIEDGMTTSEIFMTLPFGYNANICGRSQRS